MAAHIGQPTRSRRFIKVYLMTWGLLAVGALAYLAFLAFPPPTPAPPPEAGLDAPDSPPQVRAPATPKVQTTDARALEENLSEVRKDVADLQEAMGERVANEGAVQSRLTALEERVATIDPPEPPAAEPPAPDAKRPDKTAKVLAPHTTADILARTDDAAPAGAKADGLPPPATPEAERPPAAPIETGSIAPKVKLVTPKVKTIAPDAKPAPPETKVIFGEAVVKPAEGPDFAVQLAAGRSPDLLRQSWLQLVKRHGSPLASLEPRIASPGSGGSIYRLLAGPVPSKADAEQICTQMGAGPEACFATRYGGAPL